MVNTNHRSVFKANPNHKCLHIFPQFIPKLVRHLKKDWNVNLMTTLKEKTNHPYKIWEFIHRGPWMSVPFGGKISKIGWGILLWTITTPNIHQRDLRTTKRNGMVKNYFLFLLVTRTTIHFFFKIVPFISHHILADVRRDATQEARTACETQAKLPTHTLYLVQKSGAYLIITDWSIIMWTFHHN